MALNTQENSRRLLNVAMDLEQIVEKLKNPNTSINWVWSAVNTAKLELARVAMAYQLMSEAEKS